MMVARMTAGKAKTIIPAKISIVQAKIGMLVERHARRARAQHADDDLDRARDCGDLDEADAQQPEIGADPGGDICVLVSGGYMNQPPDGARPKNSVPKKTSPPMK